VGFCIGSVMSSNSDDTADLASIPWRETFSKMAMRSLSTCSIVPKMA
jgi:hypothetical protein